MRCDIFRDRGDTGIKQNHQVLEAMVLSRMLSISSLPACVKCTICTISRRSFASKHFRRSLPPTILKDIFTGGKTKKIASADFGKDATAGNDLQRAVSFV